MFRLLATGWAALLFLAVVVEPLVRQKLKFLNNSNK
jgi:hypothetical protein